MERNQSRTYQNHYMINANNQAEDILCRMEYLILTKEESAAILSACRLELSIWQGDLKLPNRIAKRAKAIDDTLRNYLSDEVALWMREKTIKLK